MIFITLFFKLVLNSYVYFTERSDLFKDMLNRNDTLEKGVHHKEGYSIVVTDYITSLAIGYPNDDFKKQMLGLIIMQAHEEFEVYMLKKKQDK